MWPRGTFMLAGMALRFFRLISKAFFLQGAGSRRPQIFHSLINVAGIFFTKTLASLVLTNLVFEDGVFNFT
jgi:hypothetical protein